MADETKDNTRGKRVADAIISQITDTVAKPIVHKIPDAIINSLKAVGGEVAIPVISVALQTWLDKYPGLGSKAGDFISEFSAELGHRMKEGGSPSNSDSKERKSGAFIFAPIFDEELSGQFNKLLKAITETIDSKSKQEIKAIESFFAKFSSDELITFLMKTKKQRDEMIKLFIKVEAEKSFEDAIKNLKNEVSKLSKTLSAEVVKPLQKKAATIKRNFLKKHPDIKKNSVRNINKADKWVGAHCSLKNYMKKRAGALRIIQWVVWTGGTISFVALCYMLS